MSSDSDIFVDELKVMQAYKALTKIMGELGIDEDMPTFRAFKETYIEEMLDATPLED